MKKWWIWILVIAILAIVILSINAVNTIKSTQTTNPSIINCLPEQRNVDACIEIYQPVCGNVNVQCVTTPCDPAKETFANSCKACTNPLVISYTEGEC